LYEPDEEPWLEEWLLLDEWLPPFGPPRAKAGSSARRMAKRRTLRSYVTLRTRGIHAA